MGAFEDFQNAMSGIQSVENAIPGVSALQNLGNKAINTTSGVLDKVANTAGGLLDIAGNPMFLMCAGAVVLIILIK